MLNQVQSEVNGILGDRFLEEYSRESTIRRYTKETAGCGIQYLLDHDYGELYFDVLEKCVPKSKMQVGIRLWEFGCGGGMNLIHLVSKLEDHGITVSGAYGTDFSPRLIDAARLEAETYLSTEQRKKVRFWVARNENLIDDVTQASEISKDHLLGSFDLLLGVNTIRYCHRLGNEDKCVQEILSLLSPGGACIVIDMNDKFPAFRSRVRDRLIKGKRACYLPSLDQYARPFQSAGFRILRKANFCWIPHSAGLQLTAFMKTLTPVLNGVAPSRAMRSVIVAQKDFSAR